MKRIRDVNLNAWVIILSLRYFDASRLARWSYTILWSGVLYFPCEGESVELADEDEDEGDKYFIPWVRNCHEASAVFRNHGWEHQVLVSAMQSNEEDMTKWRTLESEAVRRGRFDVLKGQGVDGTKLVSLAKLADGYHELLHHLLTNGFENEAITQASISRNVQGLQRLSQDLLVSNPSLRILCMQAQILSSLEDSSHDYCTDSKIVESAAEFFNSFIELYGEQSDEIETECLVALIPSLALISKSAFILALLQASKSTAEMQSIL
jgi:hypothetical protein